MSKYKSFRITRRLGGILLALVAATVLGNGLASATFAAVVQTNQRTINNGSADFGSGNHQFGGPQQNATITYDLANIAGLITPQGRVRGTLYWDAAFSSGCARLSIRFRNADGNTIGGVRRIDECGPGGDANNSANQTEVDQLEFGVFSIVLTTSELRNGSEVNSSSITISLIANRTFPVTINNGMADFGDGDHHFGHPDHPGGLTFNLNGNGTMEGRVDGVLYWDSSSNESCSRMVVEHRNSSGTLLRTRSFINCGPGGNANDGANQLFIDTGFTSSSLDSMRILVDTLSDPKHGVLQTYTFAGLVGSFEVDPAEAVAQVNEPINYALTWSVPEPLNWHDLNTLDLRVMDGSNPIIYIRFSEDGNLFSVFNEATGRFGKAFPAGTNKRLETQYASLDLGDTMVAPVNGVAGAGPLSPTVQLNLALRFKPSSAGKKYTVEVAATDDLKNEDPFTLAGSLTVLE